MEGIMHRPTHEQKITVIIAVIFLFYFFDERQN